MKRKHEIFAPMKTKNLNWWKRNHEIEKIFAKMKKKQIFLALKKIYLQWWKRKLVIEWKPQRAHCLIRCLPLGHRLHLKLIIGWSCGFFDEDNQLSSNMSNYQILSTLSILSNIKLSVELWLLWWGWSIIIKYVVSLMVIIIWSSRTWNVGGCVKVI